MGLHVKRRKMVYNIVNFNSLFIHPKRVGNECMLTLIKIVFGHDKMKLGTNIKTLLFFNSIFNERRNIFLKRKKERKIFFD